MKMVGVFVGDKGKVEVCYIFSQELSAKVRPCIDDKTVFIGVDENRGSKPFIFGLGDWQI